MSPYSSQGQPRDLPTARRLTNLCYASSLAYFPIDKIQTTDYYKNNLPNFQTVGQVVESSGTESGATIFLEDESSTIIVACRGSATIRNFATNLRFKLVPMPDKLYSGNEDIRPKVHEGFLQASEGLWELLEPILIDLSSKSKINKIIFTGHSLGGGTAELCALHYAVLRSREVGWDTELVTFGGPQIGDVNFAQYYNGKLALSQSNNDSSNIFHTVHDKDPILANNGPLWAQLGFQRSGLEISCDPYSPIIYDNGDNSDGSDDQNSFAIPPWNILDHCNYLGLYVGPRL